MHIYMGGAWTQNNRRLCTPSLGSESNIVFARHGVNCIAGMVIWKSVSGNTISDGLASTGQPLGRGIGQLRQRWLAQTSVGICMGHGALHLVRVGSEVGSLWYKLGQNTSGDVGESTISKQPHRRAHHNTPQQQEQHATTHATT